MILKSSEIQMEIFLQGFPQTPINTDVFRPWDSHHKVLSFTFFLCKDGTWKPKNKWLKAYVYQNQSRSLFDKIFFIIHV